MAEELAGEDFDDFYRRDRAAVVALAYALSGSRGAAEELAQEAFLAAYRGWDRIGAYDDPGAWVRRVVANRAVSGIRRRVAEAKALRLLGGRRQLPAELPDDSATFWGAVRALPPRQAQCVALRYIEDRSVAEIARVLDCQEATVRVHLHRGRRALADRLGLHADDDEEGDRP